MRKLTWISERQGFTSSVRCWVIRFQFRAIVPVVLFSESWCLWIRFIIDWFIHSYIYIIHNSYSESYHLFINYHHRNIISLNQSTFFPKPIVHRSIHSSLFFKHGNCWMHDAGWWLLSGLSWYDMIWSEMIWYDMVWYGLVRLDLIR